MKTFTSCLIFSLLASMSLQANSEIFPGIGGAKEKFAWKDGYFQIEGKPTFLTVGEMHYARIPRELWRDRLWRAKQMGFNCIQTYVFWNSTEPKDGVWDFSDNCDLDAWLSLIQEMGMYAIVRPGPYSCAEWDHGGFPAWLSIKPGMVLRDNDEQYLRYVDRHLAKVEAIIAKHQIHKGGNVLMVQLENEHFEGGWGTEIHSPYMTHLYDKAREAGLEIPLFFSGLHHGSDPSGEVPYKVGTTPWYSTEFWTGWIGKYGDMEPAMLYEKIRGTWKIIAFGGGGYCYYVVHGGTNFGYSGDTKDATYDYSSPIGEAGQFHNLYGPARRAASFAQSFSSLLTSSENAPGFASLTANGGRLTTRKSPQGSIVFADNFQIPANQGKAAQHIAPTADALKVESADPGKAEITTRVKVANAGGFPKDGDLILHPNEVRTLLFDLPWTASTSFESVSTNVLLRHLFGDWETWVCYGSPGDYGEVTLKRAAGSSLPAKYSFTYPKDDGVQEIPIDSGDGKKARFLIMNTALADRTWLVKDRLIVGATFVREDGSAELPPEGGKLVVYDKSGKNEVVANPVPLAELPALTGWQWRDAGQERFPGYNDSKWLTSPEVQAMETYDSFQNRYGWYRTTLKGDGKSPVSLNFMGNVGHVQAHLNGEPADLKNLKLKEGDNSLAIFMKIWPRPKMFAFTGFVGNGGARGLWGPILGGDKPAVTVNQWKTMKTEGNADEAFIQPGFDDQAWSSIPVGPEKTEWGLTNGFHWFRATFQMPENLKTAVGILPHFSEQTDKKVFVNGRPLPVIKDMNQAVDLTSLLRPGANSIAIQVKVHAGEKDKAFVRPQMEIWSGNEPLNWKFREGIEGLDETAVIGRVKNWEEFLGKPWSKEAYPGRNGPVLWRTTFDYQPKQWETVGLNTDGLKDGHVWLNGHNLGECPQKVPLYMPECWLKSGANELVILDIWGAKPYQVKLQRYEARQDVTLK